MSKLNARDFTKQNAITKSIQLELIPQGKTRKTIEEKGYLEMDEVFRGWADAVRLHIDEFVKDVIDSALSRLDTEEAGRLFAELGELLDTDAKGDTERQKKANAIKEKKDKIGKLIEAATKATIAEMSTVEEDSKPVIANISKLNSAEFVQTVLKAYVKEKYKDNQAAVDKAISDIEIVDRKQDLMTKLLISRITAIQTWMPERVLENFTKWFHGNTSRYRSILNNEDVSFEVSKLVTEDMLSDGGYVKFLTQAKIDLYNKAISGIVDPNGIVAKGVNGITNEYNHAIRGKKNGQQALPKIDDLDKQIMQPVEKSFSFSIIDEDDQVVEAYLALHEIEKNELPKMYKAIRAAKPEDVAIYGNKIRTLSGLVYGGEYRMIPEKITQIETEAIKEQSGKMSRSAYEKAISKAADKVMDKKRMYTMAEINVFMEEDVFARYKELLMEAVSNLRDDGEALESVMKAGVKIRGFADMVQRVKTYANDDWAEVRDLFKLIKRASAADIDNDFYDVYDDVSKPIMRTTSKIGHMIRNYLTRKLKNIVETNAAYYGKADRQSQKWYVGNGKLSAQENCIIRKGNRFYFFILGAGTKPVDIFGEDADCEVLTYSKMQEPFKNIPKLTMTRARDFFAANPDADEFVLEEKLTKPLVISRAIYNMYAAGACKKQKVKEGDEEGAKEAERALREGLDAILPIFIQFVETYTVWDNRSFKLKKVEEYNDLSEFYSDVAACEAVQEWKTGNWKAVEKSVEEGKALLFEITNRYLKRYYENGDASILNEYASLFLYMLSVENRKNMTVRLNASPQLTYRTAAEGKPFVHKKGSVLVGKMDKNGKPIPGEIYKEIFIYYNKPEKNRNVYALSELARKYIQEDLVSCRIAEYDITKDRRYYDEMFQLTISYEKNTECKLKNDNKSLNERAKESIPDSNRIILIRNTQDLVYALVMSPKGKILEERSLNILADTGSDGVPHYQNFHERLGDLEKANRAKKTDDWEYTGKIEDIRSGYFAKAIAEIAKLVLKYDAIIVMERIDDFTRDKFFALGNTAYKRFENMLADRLSDLHFSKVKEGEPGSLTNPYQLCYPSMKNQSNRQNGIIFYVPGVRLPSTDPETGFAYTFKNVAVNTKRDKMQWLAKFKTLRYNARKQGLEIAFDYKDFLSYAVPEKTEWEMTLSAGITEFDRDHKCNVYIPAPYALVAEAVRECGIDPTKELWEEMQDPAATKLSGKAVDMLYRFMQKSLTGIVGMHDSVTRQAYISPVTGKESDLSKNMALNLANAFEKGRG